MNNYKGNVFYGGSDIGSLSVRLCNKGNIDFKQINFGDDGCYNIYINYNMKDIPQHYLDNNNKGKFDCAWFHIIDDSEVVFKSGYVNKVEWYVCGYSLLINIVKEEN